MRIIIIYLLLFILYIASGYAQTILPPFTTVYQFSKMPGGLYQINQPGDTVFISKDSLVCPGITTTYSIFTNQIPASGSSLNDGKSITIGVKFQVSKPGKILGIKFYKTSNNSGTHTGQLYNRSGSLLASANFTGETASGWQTVLFSSPIVITANTTYIGAIYSSAGYYANTLNGFNSAVINGHVTGLASGTDGVNGIYNYGNKFPTLTYQNSNYWVDIIFSPN
jgi:hypothetical protein